MRVQWTHPFSCVRLFQQLHRGFPFACYHNTSRGSRVEDHFCTFFESRRFLLLSDNGPQVASKQFGAFAEGWSFNHVITSPRYPQSNDKVENAVKTVERLFEKCKESGVSEFQAMLDWLNTPTEGMATSRAQRLMGRRCRTLLPTSESLLRPSYLLRDNVRHQKE